MAKIGMDLNRFILEEERKHKSASGSFSLALTAIESASKIVSAKVSKAGLSNILGAADEVNISGDDVQKLDVLANNLMIQHLSDSGQFCAMASEELEEAIFPEKGKDGRYVIAFDPLDGSSNINVNVSIGTIFSIHKRVNGTADDLMQQGRKQVAAGYVIYGSSTMLVYTTGNGVNGFTLDPSVGMYLLSHPDMKVPEKGKIYSINEAYANKWDDKLVAYIKGYKDKGYSLRYIGSMVSDVHRTLIKGGVFAYPADKKNPDGKLRYLYEASPMAFIIENAGGASSTGAEDTLDVKPEELHQRVPVFLGSKIDVEEMVKALK
ncbi:MAG: class 1 fructose-bisphosphatase [Nitrospirota bacterium]|nr:MAG: class 1 fructose-bisphosphatase [Nitrospirota bacterium]